jgi:3-hydroxyethyl bacteriochlorophyllide a dehydrogenase
MPAAQTVEVRDIALTPALATDVTVQTLYTSISAGTERMLYAGQMPHPMLQFPVIPGYETVGRVIAVGSEAPATLLGQIVYVGGARCYVDVNPAWGGQSSVIHCDGQRVVTLDGLNPEHGVFLALAATALHGVDIAGDIAGKKVLILGQGPVGQLAARIAKARGATIIVTDVSAERLAHAVADQICDVSAQTLSAHGVRDCDIVIEASGSMAAAASAIGALAAGGTIVLLGYYDQIQLPYMPLFLKQARLLTSKEWAPGDLQRCRDLMVSGILDVSALLTHRSTLDQISTAYTTALFDPHCLKLLLTW